MINRIVKLYINKKDSQTFEAKFRTNKMAIRNFEGCIYLELQKLINEPSIFITYSQWESEMALNNYRNSELFKDIWSETKTYFYKNAEAFSTETIEKLK